MTKDEIDALLLEDPCYSAQATPAQAVGNLLPRRWLLALDPGADASVQGLLDASGCLVSLTGDPGKQLELALLSAITTALGA